MSPATVDGNGAPESATVDGGAPESAKVDGGALESATVDGDGAPESATVDGGAPESATVDDEGATVMVVSEISRHCLPQDDSINFKKMTVSICDYMRSKIRCGTQEGGVF